MTLNVVGVVCALASEARHLGPATAVERKESREASATRRGTTAAERKESREASTTRRGTTRRHEQVTSLADGTLLAVSGMGAAAAARSAQTLIDAGATALVSWGMAGGLDPSLTPGDVFLPTEVVSRDGVAVTTTPAWRERLGVAIAAGDVRRKPLRTQGRLLTSVKAIATVADKATLFRETRAAAVDMESLAIAEVARAHELPFIAIRVIVDSAQDALPRAVTAAADAAGHLKVWRLMTELARTPAELVPLVRLAHRYRAANRSLAAVARSGSLAP